MLEICNDNKCPLQQKPHYTGISAVPVPKTDTRINWELEDIKASRGHMCWECKNWLVPQDQDHSFCNACWDRAMEHYFEPDEEDLCVYCDEIKEHKSHLEPEPYVPDYMDEQ
jgi:hypothetical protein